MAVQHLNLVATYILSASSISRCIPTDRAAVVKTVIGDTMFIIENAISDDARETAYEKVRRLILHDTEIYQKKAS